MTISQLNYTQLAKAYDKAIASYIETPNAKQESKAFGTMRNLFLQKDYDVARIKAHVQEDGYPEEIQEIVLRNLPSWKEHSNAEEQPSESDYTNFFRLIKWLTVYVKARPNTGTVFTRLDSLHKAFLTRTWERLQKNTSSKTLKAALDKVQLQYRHQIEKVIDETAAHTKDKR